MSDDKKTLGTVQEFKDARGRKYYRARITLPDGERVWLKPRFDRRERAEEYADEKTREAERRGITVEKMAPPTPKAAGETCDAWHVRYLAHCKEQGIRTVRNKGERWGKWIAPKLGTKAPAAVSSR